MRVLTFSGEKPAECWQETRAGYPSLRHVSPEPHYLLSQERSCEPVPGVALTQSDCYTTPISFLSCLRGDHQCTHQGFIALYRNGRPTHIESETLTTFLLQNFHWFCTRSRPWEPPCRIQCKLSSHWSTVSSFLTQVLGELFIVPSPQSLPLLLLHYAKRGKQTVILGFSQQPAFRNLAVSPFSLS